LSGKFVGDARDPLGRKNSKSIGKGVQDPSSKGEEQSRKKKRESAEMKGVEGKGSSTKALRTVLTCQIEGGTGTCKGMNKEKVIKEG